MTRFASTALGLTFLLAACGGTGTAGGNNQAAAPAQNNDSTSSANGAAPANATASAGGPAGPCPFQTRGWTATIDPSEAPSVALNGEVHGDSSGRQPMLFAVGEPHAPLFVLELQSDPTVDPMPDAGWMPNGAVFPGYTAAFTHVSVRCAGREIASVPIRPAE